MGLFSSPSNPHESGPFRRILIVSSIILGCALVLGGFWFLSQLGPKEVDFYETQFAEEEVPPEVKELAERSQQLETRFEELLNLREPDAEAIALIREAMQLQEQYVDAISAYDTAAVERRDRLQRRYQNLEAKQLKEQSVELEEIAKELYAAKDYAGAESRYREAMDLQRKINEQYPLSSAYNASRSAYLQRQVMHVTAEPIRLESEALEEAGDALIAQEKWILAEEKLKEAIQLQETLNRDYRGSVQASVSRLENLKVKLIRIASGQNYLEIIRLVELADKRRAASDMLEAASLYDEAVRLQRALNKEFPGSPYASSEQVAEFQRKSQTAQSYELGLEIEQNHDLLRRLLAERRTYESAEVVVTLQRAIRQMEEAFPRSSLNDEELQVKIRYLGLIQSDLGFIQDRVYEALNEIPEVSNWKMLRTEVTQALYSLIMGSNPSRNLGDQNPVDSVSWTEAKRFCNRLSWIMGKDVRLPSENEFRQALGRLRYVVLENHVWSVEDSGGTAQKVAGKKPFATGYHDLLGNVSEWLESSDKFELEDAQHIGGHAQDRLETIFTVPLREAPRGERNRMTGFRFVMAVE